MDRRDRLPADHAPVSLVIDGVALEVPEGTTVAAAVALAAESLRSSTVPAPSGVPTAPARPLAPTGAAPWFRRSARRDEPRSALCGMGVCHECRLTIDGVHQVRSCLLPVASGMVVETTPSSSPASLPSRASSSVRAATLSLPAIPEFADVLVVGAGPAGLAAAARAARGGRSVVLVDENADAGGQVWRGGADPRTRLAGVLHLGRTAVVDARADDGIGQRDERRREADRGADRDRNARSDGGSVDGDRGGARPLSEDRSADGTRGTVVLFRPEGPDAPLREVRYRDLVLATGARELFLPFPGWTLPGVFGAGGLQALAKSGWPVAGRRIVVAGTGPLLLAVAAFLRAGGAEIVTILEQAPRQRLATFAFGLLRYPEKWGQAAALRAELASVPYRPGHWVLAAEGNGQLEAVQITDGKTRWRERCDALALGYGLVPSNELARLLGCATRADGSVVVDEDQATSVAGVWAAGEVAGIGGEGLSLAQGEIVGALLGAQRPGTGRDVGGARSPQHAASPTESRDAWPDLRAARARAERFACLLRDSFALRPELRALPDDGTIVCRCEDVTWGEIAGEPGWRDAKLVSRVGMGPCQGRVCGAALRVLAEWEADVPRPPISPVPVSAWGPVPRLAVPSDASRDTPGMLDRGTQPREESKCVGRE